MATRSSDKSLVDLLLADHQAAKKLLAKTHGSGDLQKTFYELVHDLVIHEVAEEEIVYPAFRRAGGSDRVAETRIAEQQEAERLLQKMEHMDTSSAEFRLALSQLEKAALEHAEVEEREVLPKLVSSLDADELRKLGKAFAAAKAIAPTRPHPNAPDTPPANLVISPINGLIDRARDAARSALAKAR